MDSLLLGYSDKNLAAEYGILELGIEEKHVQYITHGCIETSKYLHTPERLHQIYCQLVTLVKRNNIKKLIIERVFHSVNTRTVNSINQVHGIVYLLTHTMQLDYCEYTPLEIKRTVLQNTKAKKKEMIDKVRQLFSIPEHIKIKDDAADAIAIAYTFFIKSTNA